MSGVVGRGRRSVVAAWLVMVGSIAAGSPIAAPAGPVEAARAGAEAVLIGDSVLNALAQPYAASARDALAARHSIVLDTAGCRRLIAPSCHIPPNPAPTNALTALQNRAGQFSRAVVIAAGYNDDPTGTFGIDAAVDAVMAEAHRQGIQHVIWLTYREAGTAGNIGRYHHSNQILFGRHDPGLQIADWAARSATLPASWFSGDGIHLGGQAAAAMATLIGDALDSLLPERCLSGVWTGAPPSTAALDTTPVMGGVHLLATPQRAVDTRELSGKLGAGQVLSVPIAGVGAVPANALGAVVSVTAVEPCADTFLTVFPCGGAPPVTSVVNAVALSIVANSAVVRLGDGALCVYTLRATDVVVDVSGWIASSGDASEPVTPLRLIDTRPGETQTLAGRRGRLAPGGALTVDLSSLPGAAVATAATINVTAAAPRGSGFISVLPGPCANAALPPSTSNLNVSDGRDVAATATVALADGQLCVYSSASTDVVIDLQALHGLVGGAVTAVDPWRVTDTRNTPRLGARQTLAVDVGETVGAAIVNLTAVDPAGSGFLTLFPCGAGLPLASNLNVIAGDVVANRAIVSTGGTRRFCVYSSVDTDVVIDVEGSIT
jgi:hypothetical protein